MKIGQLYNLGSFSRFCDSATRPGFTDSEAGTILARSLTAVNPRVFEKRFPELAFVNSGIEADNIGGYARRIQSLRLQEIGGFKTAGDSSGNKGKISLAGEDSFLNVIVRKAQSKWNDDEIKEAEMGNVNLPQRYVQAHNGIYMREVDEIGLVGKDSIASGLLNYAGFATDSAAGTIDALTAQQMYDAYAGLITDQRSAVNNTAEYSANQVITPVRCINVLQATILNTAAGSSTVLRALQDNFPGVQFVGSFRADTTANGGNLATSATVAFSTNSESMVMRVPIPLTIGEIIKVGSFDFQVDSKYRIAGLDVLEDTSAAILTGL